MKTERDIRGKLSQVRREMKHKPTLWRVIVLQVYEEVLLWVLQ